MRFLFLSLLSAALGAGWLGLSTGGAQAAGTSAARECNLTVECTPRDACLVTCYDESGEICCQEEVDCGRACSPEDCGPASQDCQPAPGSCTGR